MDLSPGQQHERAHLRPITDDEWPSFAACGELAFGGPDPDEYLTWDRAHFGATRTLAGFDGTEIVSTSGAYALEMTVPGGASAAIAAVTWVSVMPTHRRQGLLGRMLTGLHQAGITRGEPFAALWATESGIYRSFGYGLASSSLQLTIPTRGEVLRRGLPDDSALRVRLVEPGSSIDAVESLLDVERARRGGVLGRHRAWSQRVLLDPTDRRSDSSPLRVVLVTDDVAVRAVARYKVKPGWQEGTAAGTVTVRESLAADPAAGVALWRYLTSLDLMSSVVVQNRPPDDPLLSWLRDPRAALPRWHDAIFIRLLDLRRSLELRRYAAPVDVILQVSDTSFPANDGQFHLIGGPDAASCTPTSAAADLSMRIDEMGAVYLGGTSLASLGAAGLVEEHTPGALAAASTAFGWPQAPWTPYVF